MFCKNCGKELNDDAVMCVNCGALLKPLPSVSAPAAVAPAAQTEPAVQFEPAEPAEKKVNGWAIAGFVLSFFGCFGIFFSVLGLAFSIVGLVLSKNLKSGKGFGIAGIVISVAAFFVHGVIMMLIMPYIMKLIGTAMVIALLLLIL